jgi:hypothetical protein
VSSVIRKGGKTQYLQNGNWWNISVFETKRLEMLLYGLRCSDIEVWPSVCSNGYTARIKVFLLSSSVADLWHFGVDPDPDPRIYASD